MGIAGILLGIIGIIAAIIATLLLGWIGGAIAITLGVIALVLGILKRSRTGKTSVGAIVVGVIAVVVAISMIPTTAQIMKTMKTNLLNELDKQETKFPTVSKYAEQADTDTGLMGFISSMAGKVTVEDRAAFEVEIKDVTNLLNESRGSAAEKKD